jgi:hypothetical protein
MSVPYISASTIKTPKLIRDYNMRHAQLSEQPAANTGQQQPAAPAAEAFLNSHAVGPANKTGLLTNRVQREQRAIACNTLILHAGRMQGTCRMCWSHELNRAITNCRTP